MNFLLHGSAVTQADIESDAKKWDVHFAPDVFHDLCTNHEHDCTKTCSKISQPKLKLNCASTKCPHPVPVFVFMIENNLKCQKKGRQGKPLAPLPHIADEDDGHKLFRFQLEKKKGSLSGLPTVSLQRLRLPRLPTAPTVAHNR